MMVRVWEMLMKVEGGMDKICSHLIVSAVSSGMSILGRAGAAFAPE